MDPYQVTLIILGTLCSALFFLVFTMLLRVYLRVRVELLVFFSFSFLLLALGQVASALSIIIDQPRLSLTLFTSSSSITSIGFLLMLFSLLRRGKEEALAVTVPLLLIAAPDVAAFALSLAASMIIRGKHLKMYVMALSASYLIRGFGSILLPMGVGAYVLITSELLKAIATSLFAMYHLGKVTIHEEA
ncbi:MAG: DUF5985 family protein [Candidatus Nezhaarchaeota archaeon]|nr:DUF5985 family protein [Candidatus Nezhaarchaeota archaeon]MCX8141248.1 DUF5985 family protein [Candidatus Nezhaarchaeota archaeon]MDW8049514.1 DUF5985 family protein [Nitrososphaerota archaeon]